MAPYDSEAVLESAISRIPERIPVAERVSAIPTKRTPPPERSFLERADVQRRPSRSRGDTLGVEVNVIRGWLGHVSLETTNRYAEVTTTMKDAALRACKPQSNLSEAIPRKPVWRDDAALLAWLDSL